MSRQTNVQQPASIIYGSAVLEVQPLGASEAWVNVGAIRGLSIVENADAVQLSGDNADIAKYIPAQTLTITFTQLEIAREDVREVIRGDFDILDDSHPDYWVITTGGRRILPQFEVRITNRDEDDRAIEFTAFNVALDQGYNLQFQADDAEDPICLNEVSMTAVADIDRPTGAQLYQIRIDRAPT